MSSKRDLEAMFSIINSFIKGLSVNEYENILNGSATLKYVEKSLSLAEKNQFDEILNNILGVGGVLNENTMDIIKEKIETKNQLIAFCNYLNIDLKSKDTKEDIYEKILIFIEENKEILINKINKNVSIHQMIEMIALELEGFVDKEQALKFLLDKKVLENKSHSLFLAKVLDVNVRKESSNLEILERIVDSVVGSKLRSMVIRGKYRKNSLE